MRPTRGVAVAVLAAVVLHVLGRITGGGWLALASAAAVVLPVVAVVLRPRLEGLEVALDPVRARVGEEVEQRLVVRSTGSRPTPPARLVDPGAGLEPVTVAVPALAAGARVEVVLRRRAVARGRRRSSLVLSSSAPLGLVRAHRALPGAEVVVAPGRVAAPALRVGGEGPGDGTASRPVAGVGTEVLGLRPWRPGDSARSLSARASARHGRPVVLERERETGPSLVVLCTGAGSGPAWEASVASACALAEDALRAGRAPVLLAAGVVAPARVDLAGVLDWCAGLDAVGPADAATVAAAARAGGTVVVLGPDVALPPGVTAVRL
jgi:uncharacterized protein (DUF58 family)